MNEKEQNKQTRVVNEGTHDGQLLMPHQRGPKLETQQKLDTAQRKELHIRPELSRFGTASLYPEIPDSYTRLDIFHWLCVIFVITLGLYAWFSYLGRTTTTDRLSELLKLLLGGIGAVAAYYVVQKGGQRR